MMSLHVDAGSLEVKIYIYKNSAPATLGKQSLLWQSETGDDPESEQRFKCGAARVLRLICS